MTQAERDIASGNHLAQKQVAEQAWKKKPVCDLCMIFFFIPVGHDYSYFIAVFERLQYEQDVLYAATSLFT